LLSKMMNRGIAYPLALTALIIVTYFRFPSCFVLSLPFLSDDVITFKVKIIPIWCHGRVSGVQTVRRYSSRRIGYRAMYVRIGNPVVCSINRT
jgi:hypothetical protein